MPEWRVSAEAMAMRERSTACRSCYFNTHAEMNLLFRNARIELGNRYMST